MLTWPILAYLAVLWALRNAPIVHALAINWAVNQGMVMLNGGFENLPAFVLVDFLTGLWLCLSLGGRQARQAATFFLPMIALNAAAYAAGTVPFWHHTALFGLAWLQLLWVVIGVKGDGFLETLDHTSSGIRNAVSRAASHFRSAK